MILTGYRREDYERHYASGRWQRTTLPDLLEAHAGRHPARLALDDGARRYTYADLRRAVLACAARLAGLGLDRGSVVAIQLPNCAEFVVTALACSRVGAIMSPLPVGTGPREAIDVLTACGAEGYVVASAVKGAPFLPHARLVRAEVPTLRAVLVAGLEAPDGVLLPLEAGGDLSALDAIHPSPDDVLDLMYTSGTTGRPKGILNTTNSKLAGLRGFLEAWRLDDREVWAVLAPLAHNAGWLYSYLPAFVPGGSAYLLREYSPASALALLRRARATATFMVPTQARDLLEADREGLPALRYVGIGAAETPAALKRRVREQWGSTPIAMYGMTECQANLFTRPDDPPTVVEETVGSACPGMEVVIFDPTRDHTLPDGEVGEVATRGAGLFAGYYDDQRATSAGFNKDGWFFSGDIGSLRDGHVTLHGRIKDVIVRAGHNVVPEAIEAHLAFHPAVADVAVVGVPHERLGEVACACVIPRGEAPRLEDLVTFLRERGVGAHLWPERLVVLAEFPRTPLGKVQRTRLKAIVLGGQP